MALGLEAHVCPGETVSLTRSGRFHARMSLETPLILEPTPAPKLPIRKAQAAPFVFPWQVRTCLLGSWEFGGVKM